MKAQFAIISLAAVISGCAIQPTLVSAPEQTQRYALHCNAGIEKCYQRAAEICTEGYDVIEHSKSETTVVPHYGQYPMIIKAENLEIECH